MEVGGWMIVSLCPGVEVEPKWRAQTEPHACFLGDPSAVYDASKFSEILLKVEIGEFADIQVSVNFVNS
jgi:hypothetical protein